MVLAEAPWLHTLGDIAGVVLIIELSLALIIVCALMLAMAYGAHWVHVNVMPLVQDYLPRAQQAMSATEQGSDSLVKGVAEFYSRRQALETGLRVFLFGKSAVQSVREEQEIYAEETLQRIEPPSSLLGNALETAPLGPQVAHNERNGYYPPGVNTAPGDNFDTEADA
jgi:hypothetical protein